MSVDNGLCRFNNVRKLLDKTRRCPILTCQSVLICDLKRRFVDEFTLRLLLVIRPQLERFENAINYTA